MCPGRVSAFRTPHSRGYPWLGAPSISVADVVLNDRAYDSCPYSYAATQAQGSAQVGCDPAVLAPATALVPSRVDPEASGCLVAPPVVKTGERRTAALAGSIPVRLRHLR